MDNQNFLTNGQSLSVCMIDPSCALHKGHSIEQSIPLYLITCLVGILAWLHNQRKCLSFGNVSTPQTQQPKNEGNLGWLDIVKR